MPEAERRATDYDDVDPVELNFADHRIVFVSSRTPDLGRDHARRSTTLWVRHADGRTEPASANRNNDRWPFLMTSGYLGFSLWSRNREAITADRTDVRPLGPNETGSSAPADGWLGAFTQMPGGHFGMLVKPAVPVWRVRPLFANRLTFMTTFAEPPGEHPPLTVVQALPGTIARSPSARPAGHPLPRSKDAALRRGPDRDAAGRPLWLATPSPCPPSNVLLAAAPVAGGATKPEPGAYGLYLARDDWPEGDAPADPAAIDLRLMFDDPDLVDAEPVAVYERAFKATDRVDPPPAKMIQPDVPLLTGGTYSGPTGHVFSTGLDLTTPMADLPGQRTDAGDGPIFDGPPPGAVDHLRIYAARRDRFDDPVRPRVAGEFELILKAPVKKGATGLLVPTDAPTVLAGFDRDGRVVQWQTKAKDAGGRSATFYAYAGDHYSLTRMGGRHFCVGCHPGHSGLPFSAHDHAERVR
jgi:hypothetical protein